MTGVWALLGALAVAGAIGVLLKVREGRISRSKDSIDLPAPVRDLLAPGVTLVQLSTTFCAPCRHAKVVLRDLADRTDGLTHAELDVTNLPDVTTRLGVMRTPTTLALTSDGTEVLRVGGVPKRDSLLAALRPHLP
ncbi:thioredoxin family protein [Lentzea albidocapillata]|uniref:Thiol-disulfide isomerase or thioredoxin n=1 Tax=Lentzea albidocapillata TaxID=40571 RepID=A0A1W2EAI8_9PSEU|nr:thioredoxin family protein [Lentzea albidocapillata]SMD06810.1 Thiol-disulfide isomerase or thioredoxin [Lentzea albidocapillata]